MLLTDLTEVLAAGPDGLPGLDSRRLHADHERDVEEWILATIDRMRATSPGPYSAYIWAYDHRGGHLVSCMLRGAAGEPLTLAFRFGQDDGESCVLIGLPMLQDPSEAVRLLRMLASRLEARLTICRGA